MSAGKTPRFLVVQTAFIGDVVLTTPLIARLAQRGDVDVVTTPAGASLLRDHPGVRHTFAYDKKRGSVHELLRVLKAVRAAGPVTAAYLAQGSSRSGLLAWATGAPRRIGFSTSAGKWSYTSLVTPPDPQFGVTHHAQRLWQLDAGDTLATAEDVRPRLYPPPEAVAEANALLVRSGWSGESLVALAPGSVWGTKRWPYFAQLSQRIEHRGRVVVLGGRDDQALASEIVAAGAAHVVDATGQLSLLASAALLSMCRAIVTNDSAPLHLASAMNVPTVAIFGPTSPLIGYGPLAAKSIVVENTGLPCRPCHSHGPRVCPLGHFQCMRDVTSDRVLAALDEVLGGVGG